MTARSAATAGSPAPWDAGGSVQGLTLPQLLAMRVDAQAQAPAVRAIERGAVVTYSWSHLQEAATTLAGAFAALGFQPGARAILVGPARWSLLVAEHAVWRAGGIAAALSHHLDSNEFASLVSALDPSLCVVDMAGISSNLRGRLSRIIGQTSAVAVAVDSGLAGKTTPGFLALADLDATAPIPDPSFDSTDAAAIVFSSGRIRPPRPIVHSHASLLAAALEARTALPTLPTRAVLICAIPSAHYLGKLATVTLPLVSHVVPHLPERPDLELEAVRQLAPHVLLGPPRFFEKLAARVEGGLDRSGRVRKRIIAGANDRDRGFSARLAQLVIFRPFLRRLGLHRLRLTLTGGAPIDDQAIRLWHHWGVGLKRFYSLAELGGPVALESRISGVLQSAPVRTPATLAVDSHRRLLLEGEIPSLGTWSKGTVEPWSGDALNTGDLALMTGQGLQLIGRADDAAVCPEIGLEAAELAAQSRQLDTVDEAFVHCGPGVPAVVLLLTPGGGDSSSTEVEALLERTLVGSPEIVIIDRPLDPARGELTLLGEPRIPVVLEHSRTSSGHASTPADCDAAAFEVSEEV